MKLLRNFCRTAAGLVFILSGFVKGIDLLGSDYKFADYFTAFHLEALSGAIPVLACLLTLVEFLMGICLLFNIRIRNTAWAALAAMAFFTPLSLILAVSNPVKDCGCFGDALVLTNWQTFGKNLVLLAMVLTVFYHRKSFKPGFTPAGQAAIAVVSLLFMGGLEWYCSRHLPILDFRPYSVGKNIREGMEIPADAPQDEYEIRLEYRNRLSGEIKEFSEQDYPWRDTLTWEYHSSTENLVRQGYRPPISGLAISHPESGEITDALLEEEYVFLAVCYRLDRTGTDALERLDSLAAYAEETGWPFYGLTASSREDTERFIREHGIRFGFCNADEIQLKTMIRSNPGLILLHRGTVLRKWADCDIPEVGEIRGKDLTALFLHEKAAAKDRYLLFTLVLAATALLLAGCCRKGYRGG